MHLRAPAIVLASRTHGETAVIARMLTEQDGMVAAYVAGGRGRRLRPVVIPGNLVEADIRAKSDSQLPFARLELVASRGPWLSEPLPAAAIAWNCALTGASLAERSAHPQLFHALSALLDAICGAPSARGWVEAQVGYEALLLRELGYGADIARPSVADLADGIAKLESLSRPIAVHLLGEARGDVMAARIQLLSRLRRMI